MRFLTLLFIIVLVVACQKEQADPKIEYGLQLPTVTPSYNLGINNAIPELGRVLFYDPRLSESNDVSCGSCHKQKFGFADNARISKGLGNHFTSRNSMAILNSGLSFFWDGREMDLKKMVMMPVRNPDEMGVTNINALVTELNSLPYYRDLTMKAYGYDKLNEGFISDALMWFVKSIQPNQSRFDLHLAVDPVFLPFANHKPSPYLNDQEMEGMKLFLEKYDCNRCHNLDKRPALKPAPIYGSGPNVEFFVNIGLDDSPVDKGRQNITRSPGDEGKFRIPSLRNIALTGPYMHDGRFATMEQVIEHYANNVKDNANLDINLRDFNFQPKRFIISSTEKSALIAFLGTLTDYNVIKDPKWSDPFARK